MLDGYFFVMPICGRDPKALLGCEAAKDLSDPDYLEMRDS